MSSADRDRGACAGTAGQCFTDATLEDAQPDVRAVDDFHEADIHAFRESWVFLDGGPEPVEWGAGHRGYGQHSVRIAH